MPDLTLSSPTLFLTMGSENSAFLAGIAEGNKIRIVNRLNPLWPYISRTKWGDAVRNAVNEKQQKMLWISGHSKSIVVDDMICISFFADFHHVICAPKNEALSVFKN